MNLKGAKAVVLGGKTGLLGQALTNALQNEGASVQPLSSQDADMLDQNTMNTILDHEQPDIVFNAAAYTQVDLAEEEEEKAFALNATAPVLTARLVASRNIPFVHFSTDFVFNGRKNTPYHEEDRPNAKSVYGISKAGGEKSLLEFGYDKTLIVRISWLFGPGKMNFVQKILELAKDKDRLNVVSDQTGSPSYTPDVAASTLELVKRDHFGIVHVANSGIATWFDLASEAVSLAGLKCTVQPISTSEYPTKAVRPPYSVLDLTSFCEITGQPPRHWRQALQEYITELEST
jgi:dTDP-4-dehydrorhamnose reductase